METNNKSTQMWTVRRGDKIYGPFPPEQLRNLANNGKLKMTDLVRCGDGGWQEASTVVGLFAKIKEPSVVEAMPVETNTLGFAGWYKSKWIGQQAIPAQVALWFLYGYLWIPGWYFFSTNDNKHQKTWIIGGVVALSIIFILGLIGSQVRQGKTTETIQSAHQLWDTGKQAEAIVVYRNVLKDDLPFVAKKDRALLFERTITFDAENDNSGAAFDLLNKANESNVVVISQSPKTQSLIAQWKQDRQQQLEQERSKEISSNSEEKSMKSVSMVGWFKKGRILDFLDNPHKYKNTKITIDSYLDGQDLTKWIEDGVMRTNLRCNFRVSERIDGHLVGADLWIIIPKGTKVTPIRSGEDVRVTFRCFDGSLENGNYADEVERP